MNSFWNERYSSNEYAYGTEPNQFFKNELAKLRVGKLLLPGEGEGRNAVHAAKLGWKTTAFDFSSVAINKANKLAAENNVEINYLIESFDSFVEKEHYFDSIALIFVHPSSLERERIHTKFLNYLKPGGTLILEGFSEKQIKNNTGGPRNSDALFTKENIIADFSLLKCKYIEELEIHLTEGLFHNGKASVIRFVGIK